MRGHASPFRSRLLCLALSIAVLSGPSWVPAAAAARTLVYIDPGHGGPYSNANVNGLMEKDINLAVSWQLMEALKDQGYGVGMTRFGDWAVTTRDIPTWHSGSDGYHLYADGATSYSSGVPYDDLQARCDAANRDGADLFVCIHCNGVSSSSARGTETFAASLDPLGQQLSAYVQSEVIAEMGTLNRGAKIENFYVLRWSNMPAILIECGFLSNDAEASLLADPGWRWRFGRAMARGITRFLATDPFKQVYPRIGGADRYDTAAKLSQAAWPNGAGTVLLASGESWPDAVAAAPLARKLDAPILLTPSRYSTRATRAEIRRLNPSRIIVLGGPEAVRPKAVHEAASVLPSTSVTVQRIGGNDRYETAALIASETGVPADGRVCVVSGRQFSDAVSIAPWAGRYRLPILLADGPALPAATAAFVTANHARIEGAVVAGSSGSVPDSALTGFPWVKRVAGSDRWGTNVAVMSTFYAQGGYEPVVAQAEDFPDPLVAACYAAKIGQPLMLTQKRVLPNITREHIECNAGSAVRGFKIVGGTAALPYLMDWELKKAYD